MLDQLSTKNIVDANLKASVDGVRRQPGLFRTDFPLMEELHDTMRNPFEVEMAVAPTSF
jgi:hypothetical protein